MYSDRKRVRKHGHKVSTNDYQAKALQVIEREDGIAPSTLIYKMSFEPNESETIRLRTKLFELISFYIEQGRQSRVA